MTHPTPHPSAELQIHSLESVVKKPLSVPQEEKGDGSTRSYPKNCRPSNDICLTSAPWRTKTINVFCPKQVSNLRRNKLEDLADGAKKSLISDKGDVGGVTWWDGGVELLRGTPHTDGWYGLGQPTPKGQGWGEHQKSASCLRRLGLG